jgi:hypothetical protein
MIERLFSTEASSQTGPNLTPKSSIVVSCMDVVTNSEVLYILCVDQWLSVVILSIVLYLER